jgi:hypothetical protein
MIDALASLLLEISMSSMVIYIRKTPQEQEEATLHTTQTRK